MPPVFVRMLLLPFDLSDSEPVLKRKDNQTRTSIEITESKSISIIHTPKDNTSHTEETGHDNGGSRKKI